MSNTQTSSKERTLCLETLREGAAVERFNDELQVILANALDPNTSYKVKRKITLTVTFAPDEDRRGMDIEIKCESKLAPPKSVDGYAYLRKNEKGEITATEFNPSQPELPMVGQKRDAR
jgi:hypothetical protein